MCQPRIDWQCHGSTRRLLLLATASSSLRRICLATLIMGPILKDYPVQDQTKQADRAQDRLAGKPRLRVIYSVIYIYIYNLVVCALRWYPTCPWSSSPFGRRCRVVYIYTTQADFFTIHATNDPTSMASISPPRNKEPVLPYREQRMRTGEISDG